MINPFKHVGKVMLDQWQSAASNDVAPGQAKAAVVVLSPVIVGYSLISALFKKAE